MAWHSWNLRLLQLPIGPLSRKNTILSPNAFAVNNLCLRTPRRQDSLLEPCLTRPSSMPAWATTPLLATQFYHPCTIANPVPSGGKWISKGNHSYALVSNLPRYLRVVSGAHLKETSK